MLKDNLEFRKNAAQRIHGGARSPSETGRSGAPPCIWYALTRVTDCFPNYTHKTIVRAYLMTEVWELGAKELSMRLGITLPRACSCQGIRGPQLLAEAVADGRITEEMVRAALNTPRPDLTTEPEIQAPEPDQPVHYAFLRPRLR
jgi:hypothetical protein